MTTFAGARWGQTAHLVFLFFCLLTNVLVTSMLLLGGAAVVNALTGMSTYAYAPRHVDNLKYVFHIDATQGVGGR